jgi:hypothetical protein
MGAAENPDASLAGEAKAPGRREAMWEPRAQNQTLKYAPGSRHYGKKPARGRGHIEPSRRLNQRDMDLSEFTRSGLD